MLKRIQRDRDEQLKHRARDSQRLIQRNKNILHDVIERHLQEAKKTHEYLKFALGKRSKPTGINPQQSKAYLNAYLSSHKLPLIRSVAK